MASLATSLPHTRRRPRGVPYVKAHGNRSSRLGCRVETNKHTHNSVPWVINIDCKSQSNTHTTPYRVINIDCKSQSNTQAWTHGSMDCDRFKGQRSLTIFFGYSSHWAWQNEFRFHYAQMYSLGARIFERLVNSDQRAQFQKFTEPPGGVWSNFFCDAIDTLCRATIEWNIMALCKKVWKK